MLEEAEQLCLQVSDVEEDISNMEFKDEKLQTVPSPDDHRTC